MLMFKIERYKTDPLRGKRRVYVRAGDGNFLGTMIFDNEAQVQEFVDAFKKGKVEVINK
jgi:hypothetical protein